MSQAGEDEAGTWNVEERQGRWIQEEQGEDLVTDLRGSRVEGVIPHFRLPAGCKHQEARVSGFILVLPGTHFQWQPPEGGTCCQDPDLQGGSQKWMCPAEETPGA